MSETKSKTEVERLQEENSILRSHLYRMVQLFKDAVNWSFDKETKSDLTAMAGELESVIINENTSANGTGNNTH